MTEPERADDDLSVLDLWCELGRVRAVAAPGVPAGAIGTVTGRVGGTLTVLWDDVDGRPWETIARTDQVRELPLREDPRAIGGA